MFHDTTRRRFLGSSAAAAGLALAELPSRTRASAANERLSVAIVGAGMRGSELLRIFAKVRDNFDADLTAVCDLWSVHRERGVALAKQLNGREPRAIRLFHQFSSGIIDQWMSHMIDVVHMLTGATFPSSVVAHGGTYAFRDHRENGDTVQVLLDYPAGFLCSYSTTLVNGFGRSGRGCWAARGRSSWTRRGGCQERA